MRSTYKILVGKLEGNLRDLGIDGTVILNWILKKQGVVQSHLAQDRVQQQAFMKQ
jgi:hypothetical protein